MAVLRVIYWPALAFARWLDGQAQYYERVGRTGRRRHTDAGLYRFVCCFLWTAILAFVAITIVWVT